MNSTLSSQIKTQTINKDQTLAYLNTIPLVYPNATVTDKVAYVNDETTPGFKRRVVGALQAGSEAAIEDFLDNPYVNVVKAIVKGWIKPE